MGQGAARTDTPALSLERYRLALEAGRMGTWFWDVVTNRLDWDDELCRVFGLEPASFAGTFDAYLALLHPDDVASTVDTIQQSLARRQDHYVEHRVVHPDASVHWISGTGRVVLDPRGEVVGMVGVGADITEQRAAHDAWLAAEAASAIARDAAERSQARLALLGRVSGVLGASLDVATTMQQLAHLVVSERLADWCVVELARAERGPDRLALAHRDPAMVALARRLQERYPSEVTTQQGVGKVLATGEPEFWPSIPPEMVEAAAQDEEHLQLLRSLKLSAALVLPLKARGRTLGALSMAGSGGRTFDADDLATASELAARAAVALDNAQLFADRDRVARTLQSTLLPPLLPSVSGLDIGAVYRPGSEALGIGGDFYDVVPTGRGTWLVSVGDVCGKGVEAAALTATVRYALRTAAVLAPSPARILQAVNETLVREEWQDRFATLMVADVAPPDAGPDGLARLVVAGGGHPPAVIRRADGSVERTRSTGTLVGVLAGADFVEEPLELHPGDCLLLYTDGVTEAGQVPDLFGDRRLDDALTAADVTSARRLAQEILAAVEMFRHATGADSAGDPDRDDLAVLAIRVPR